MKVRRIVEKDVDIFKVGDQINIGKYTATAMKQDGNCMIFCMDQYLDKAYSHVELLKEINHDITTSSTFSEFLVDFYKKLVPFGTNKYEGLLNDMIIGGATAEEMIRANRYLADCITSEKENGVEELRKKYQKTSEEDGYLFRIPYAGEIFMGTSEEEWVRESIEPDNDGEFYEGWPMMKDRRNRIASRKDDEYEYGWLMNKKKNSAAYFAGVNGTGGAGYGSASAAANGVRPVFQVMNR